MSDVELNKFIYSCTNCGNIVNEETKICPKCGENVEEIDDEAENIEVIKVPFHFKTLLFYSNFVSFIGWLLVICGVTIILFSFSLGFDTEISNSLNVFWGIILVVIGILVVANGQLLSCIVTIEKNSRETNNILWIKLNAIIKKIN